MTYQEFVASRKKAGQDLLDSWNPDRASAVHMLVGLADEMIEFVGATDAENAKEELGDLIFYVEGVLQDYGLTLPEEIYADIFPAAFPELFTMLKRDLMYNKGLDLEKLQAEAENTLRHAMAHLTIEWEVIADFAVLKDANVAKLTKRYESGYSDKAAQERADKSE